MIIVALWCIQMKPSDHPSMSKAVQMLKGKVDYLQMPTKPSLSSLDIITKGTGGESLNQSRPCLKTQLRLYCAVRLHCTA
jgi:hypothetical protein